MSSKLSLLGGEPVIASLPRPYFSIGRKEAAAVEAVMASGCLSGFYGSPGEFYMGGPKVREFEAAWGKKFNSRHAISVNSNTSGLLAALGAAGVSPGDEVIVPPWSMSASVVTPLFYGGIPVFADVEEDTFCLDVDAVKAAITPKTRVILAVNLFGHPARLHELRKLADEKGLVLIEDNAQAPLASEQERYAGTVGHMGVFSLNYHKHIHTGEGGVVLTDDDDLAARLAAIRNHGENVVEAHGITDITNMIGLNLRMTELSAAVGLAQLEDAQIHIGNRVRIAERLSQAIEGLPGLTPPQVRDACRHVYYVWNMKNDEEVTGIGSALFVKALAAEGVPVFQGYVDPLYKLPLFRERMAIGRDGFPFTLTDRTYEEGLCPVTERLQNREIMGFEVCAYDLSDEELDLYERAFHKVYEGIEDLRKFEIAQA